MVIFVFARFDIMREMHENLTVLIDCGNSTVIKAKKLTWMGSNSEVGSIRMLIYRYHLHFNKSLEFAVPQRSKFEASFCTLVNLCDSVLLLFARRACVFMASVRVYACGVI